MQQVLLMSTTARIKSRGALAEIRIVYISNLHNMSGHGNLKGVPDEVL